jgi:pantoate--beta-alanine ligase
MEVFDAPAASAAWSQRCRAAGRVVAVVPTMGALHRGHVALVAEARRRADAVIVTIFVNPLQFNQTSDFDLYPRPIDGDLEICRSNGVDAVYAPTAATMYPTGFETRVVPGALADRLEGPLRPGHFEGVTTVVTKLFNATQPDLAVFGEKDFQQLAIVRRMTTDLDMPIEVVGVATVREHDGLALSSRNSRLTPADRAAAPVIARALEAAGAELAAGTTRADVLVATARGVLAGEQRARVEYVEVVDAATLEQVAEVDGPAVMLTAVWFGDVRLIDNRRF